MAAIPSNLRFPTSRQIPDHSIMDISGKQAYLGNQYCLPVAGFSITGTAETNVALITNPSTAVSLFIFRRSISAVGALAQFKFYFNPTVTAGIVATPVNSRIASGSTSLSVCSTAPTGSTRGTLVDTIECPTADWMAINNTVLIIDPAQSMLVTCTPGATSLVTLNMCWHEI